MDDLVQQAVVDPVKLVDLPSKAAIAQALLQLEAELPHFETQLTMRHLNAICERTEVLRGGRGKKQDVVRGLLNWARASVNVSET